MSKTASPQKAPAGAPVGGIDATLKLSYGRLAAGRRMPYFAGAVLSMVPREVPRGTLNTLGVTRRGVLLYDPDYIDTLTVPEMAADLLHEVSHLLRNHHDRCARIGADPKLWNSAADAEINDDLVAAKLAFKPPFVLPSQFEAEDGLMAEQYYVLLQTKVAQNQGEMPDKVGTRQCGSGAGWAGSAEPDDSDPANRTAQEIEMTRRSAAQAVKDHAAQHGVGSVPDGWVEWADLQLAAPKVPWEQKLARAIKHAVGSRPGAVDLTWRRRSRLQGGLGFGVGAPVLRGTHAPIPRVGIGVDTSGSIGAEEINRAGSEIEAILKTVQADVDFMAADAAVQSDVRVRSLAQVVANLKGGGGTDFRPMFKRFAEKNPPPEMVVFITDGCGPAPATPPPYAVIWVLVGAYRSRPQMYAGDKPVGECAWGEFIEVDDKPTPEGAEV